MARKKGLGRGLDALIPGGTASDAEAPPGKTSPRQGGGPGDQADAAQADLKKGGLSEINIDKISAGKLQPRESFDPQKINELAESIESQGILQPLVVRPRASGGYELIAGERRLRAARQAGLDKVPAVVREIDDRGALELALVENLQREDLDPIEEAQAYRRLINEFEYTQEQLAKRVGKDRATISNLLRLLSLPEDIIEDVRESRISAGHARAILGAETEFMMRRIRDAAVDEGISVREAERMASGEKKKKKKGPGKRGKSSDIGERETYIREMEETLVRELGTKVEIARSGKGGRINVAFFSEEDLDRIYRRIVGR